MDHSLNYKTSRKKILLGKKVIENLQDLRLGKAFLDLIAKA